MSKETDRFLLKVKRIGPKKGWGPRRTGLYEVWKIEELRGDPQNPPDDTQNHKKTALVVSGRFRNHDLAFEEAEDALGIEGG